MAINGQSIIQLMEEIAPKHLAVEHDTIGLQLGTLNKKVERVLITLDVTESVVDEAIALQADLIIAHHAIIFRPLTKIDIDVPAGRIYEKLLKHDIAVYVSHTNLDSAVGGVNDLLASAIGMNSGGKILESTHKIHLVKLFVTVPQVAVDEIIEGVKKVNSDLAVNHINRTQGNGSVIHLEFLIAESDVKATIQTLKKNQYIDEINYYTITLNSVAKEFGLGRVNSLNTDLDGRLNNLADFAKHIKEVFQLQAVKVVGNLSKPIKKVAVLGGMGAKYVRKAKFAGADVIVTGDIDFHTAQDALAEGMAIIDAGHHIEHVMIKGVASLLTDACAKSNFKVSIMASSVNTDPFKII